MSRLLSNITERKLSDFVPFVKPYHVKAPENVIEVALQKAARTFAMRTSILNHTFTFSQQAQVTEYFLELPCELDIHRIDDVMVDGCCLPQAEGCECPHGYYFEPDCTLHIFPYPRSDRDNNVQLTASVVPAVTACVVPEILFSRHRDDIVMGAASELHKMPHLEGSNLVVSDRYAAEFEMAITKATSLKKRQYSGAAQRVTGMRLI